MNMTRKLLAALVVLTLFDTAAQALQEDDKARLTTNILQNHIVPRFAVFEVKTAKLHAAMDATCTAGKSLGHKEIRQVFSDAVSATMGIQHLRFGPTVTGNRLYRMLFGHEKNRAERQVRRLFVRCTGKHPEQQAAGETQYCDSGISCPRNTRSSDSSSR